MVPLTDDARRSGAFLSNGAKPPKVLKCLEIGGVLERVLRPITCFSDCVGLVGDTGDAPSTCGNKVNKERNTFIRSPRSDHQNCKPPNKYLRPVRTRAHVMRACKTNSLRATPDTPDPRVIIIHSLA